MDQIFEYEIADGKLFVQILAADRELHGGDYYGNGATEEIKGRVHVSTSAEFKSETGLGFVKVRGRKYGMELTLTRRPQAQVREDYRGRLISWDKDRSYTGDYRSDRGRQVEYSAKAHNALDVIRDEVLAKFEADRPDWVKESTLLLFKRERDNREYKARQLQAEALEEQRKAESWGERVLALAAELA
ncbi:hypothetical protein [Streptomyces sp. NPDC056796]|uniref:hypothetical protein n=1 Tax=Streptomyces sp. NPDC056796 TaxID=3345947 RepID=UPI0036A91906